MTGSDFEGAAVEVVPEDTLSGMVRDAVAGMTTQQTRSWIVRLLAACGKRQLAIAEVMRCSTLTVRRDAKGPTSQVDDLLYPGAGP